MSASGKTCGYYPPASEKALRRAVAEMGTREIRKPRNKPCGKPATFVAQRDLDDTKDLYLCGPHAQHNAKRGFPSTRTTMTHSTMLMLSDENRSAIATAFIAGRDDPSHGLCCASDALEACAAIVGVKFALTLQQYAYNELGCEAFDDEAYEADVVERYLDKIATLQSFEIVE